MNIKIVLCSLNPLPVIKEISRQWIIKLNFRIISIRLGSLCQKQKNKQKKFASQSSDATIPHELRNNFPIFVQITWNRRANIHIWCNKLVYRCAIHWHIWQKKILPTSQWAANLCSLHINCYDLSTAILCAFFFIISFKDTYIMRSKIGPNAPLSFYFSFREWKKDEKKIPDKTKYICLWSPHTVQFSDGNDGCGLV